MLDVLAFIGFDNFFQVTHDRSIGQYNFKSKNPLSHHTITKRFAAPGIRGNHAANGARTTRGQIYTDRKPVLPYFFFQLREHHARIHDSETGCGVNLADVLHLIHHYNKLTGRGFSPTGQTCTSAMRDDADPLRSTARYDSYNICGGFRTNSNACIKIPGIETRITTLKILRPHQS